MPEIKKRGRPSKDTQTQNPSYCIIKDPLMEPFFISKDATNFTVIEKSISTRGFAGKKATGKEIHAPSQLSNFMDKEEKFDILENNTSKIKKYILEKVL